MSEPVTSAVGGTGDSESGLTARWVTFGYLFTLYFILGGAETMMSPLFPLVEPDLDITESNLAAILASVSAGIAAFNILGGISSRWLSDRSMVRASATALAAGMVLSAVAQTFWVLLIGQTLLGVAFGIYFPPGLASVARLYRGAEGKAIAVWGQAYSFGLAAAALSVFAGENWRWVYVGCAVPSLLAIAYVPRWVEADRGTAPEPWLAQLVQYARKQTYRLAGYASFGGVSMHFVVIGFSPVFFESQGVDLRLVGVLLAAGRFLSAPVKLVGGAMYDRRGGPWTARLMMVSTAVLGLPMLLLPAQVGVWMLVPFVGMAVSVLPVSNAMLVAALPAQSGWGIGTFRAGLLGSAALLSAIMSGLLSLGVPLSALMLAALGLPALVAVAMHRAAAC
ncbi:MAG: MFS transporter [Acidimicrobiaceae bacterium]|nr:MFS transporter [Acidimicrobiaceae bacterium]